MTTLTFDTLAYAKKLKSVGFTEEQAEAQAETIIALLTEQLVTRDYQDVRLKELDNSLTIKIKELETKLSREIKELETKLSREIKELEIKIKELDVKIENSKSEIIKWVAAMLVAQAGLIAGLIVGLFKLFK